MHAVPSGFNSGIVFRAKHEIYVFLLDLLKDAMLNTLTKFKAPRTYTSDDGIQFTYKVRVCLPAVAPFTHVYTHTFSRAQTGGRIARIPPRPLRRRRNGRDR